MNPKKYQKRLKYEAEHYDRLSLRVYKGQRDEIKKLAAELGMSLNGYIRSVLTAALLADKIHFEL